MLKNVITFFSCRAVDSEVLSILRKRFEDCVLYEGPDSKVRCAHIRQQYEEAETNWFIKC